LSLLNPLPGEHSVNHVSRFLLLSLLCISTFGHSQEPITLKLWPNGVPGTPTTKDPETTLNRPDLNDKRGPVHRITNVTDPTLTVYRAAKPNGAAIVDFPGGGYRWLAIDIEGSEVCDFFTRAGITCIVVKYRVPQLDQHSRYEQPLQDAQRALGIVRLHAKEWKIDPDRIGVVGFSAGGQLSAVLSNNFQKRTYTPLDDADQQSCRPNFAVILYPGYLNSAKQDGTVAPEVMPSADTPPTFLFQTEDDSAHVENSLAYYAALKNAKVPVEMHNYPVGGHGYGTRGQAVPVAGIWPNLVIDWMKFIKVLPVVAAK
jgi:acetyl esterase/lipase